MTPAQDIAACRICTASGKHAIHTAREMMFGFREPFRYLECAECGCLQLVDPPPSMTRYYPPGYYSFVDIREPGPWRRYALRRRFEQAAGVFESALGRVLVRRYGVPPLAEWARRFGLDRTGAVLDVGCGKGILALEMHACGFKNVSGVDPFVERDIVYRCGVRVLKCDVADYDGHCDLAMLHHSFEHMPDPEATLRHLARIVNPGGHVLIRIPVADSHAWETYGVDWYQLDAPRHFFLHTARSLSIIAERAGFHITERLHDSTGRQFWASEQYRRDIPLNDVRSYSVDPAASVFSPEQIAAFERDAEVLNREGRGDQCCFYLTKDRCE